MSVTFCAVDDTEVERVPLPKPPGLVQDRWFLGMSERDRTRLKISDRYCHLLSLIMRYLRLGAYAGFRDELEECGLRKVYDANCRRKNINGITEMYRAMDDKSLEKKRKFLELSLRIHGDIAVGLSRALFSMGYDNLYELVSIAGMSVPHQINWHMMRKPVVSYLEQKHWGERPHSYTVLLYVWLAEGLVDPETYRKFMSSLMPELRTPRKDLQMYVMYKCDFWTLEKMGYLMNYVFLPVYAFMLKRGFTLEAAQHAVNSLISAEDGTYIGVKYDGKPLRGLPRSLLRNIMKAYPHYDRSAHFAF